MKTRDLLVSLGFMPVTDEYTDQQPGYRYDFGNMVLRAKQIANLQLHPTMQFSGRWATPDRIGTIDFALLLEVESYEQGVAILAFNIGDDFTPSRSTPWLEQGRAWEAHLPGKREMRLFRARPQCHVEADWFRVAAKKLRLIGETADQTKSCTVSFQDGVLKFDLSDTAVAMPATGSPWPMKFHLKAAALVHLSKRTPPIGVGLGVWQGRMTIGNRLIPLGTDPLAVPTTSNDEDELPPMAALSSIDDRWDEETYEKARPLFQEVVDNLSDPASDTSEAMRILADVITERFGVEIADRMKPFADRFVGEIQNVSAAPSGTENDDLVDDEVDVAPPTWVVRAVDNAESALATLVDKAQVDRRSPEFANGVRECHLCRCDLQMRGLFVDCSVRGKSGCNGVWANLCSQCYERLGTGIGWGKGQLYARQPNGEWRLVAGFR